MKFPSRDDIQRIREHYPVGARTELIYIANDSGAVPKLGATFSMSADLKAVGYTLPCVGLRAFL